MEDESITPSREFGDIVRVTGDHIVCVMIHDCSIVKLSRPPSTVVVKLKLGVELETAVTPFV